MDDQHEIVIKPGAGVMRYWHDLWHAPTLAIAVYHRLSDFIRIPTLIESMYPRYEFYLGHYTIHAGGPILFASVQKRIDFSPCCCPVLSL